VVETAQLSGLFPDAHRAVRPCEGSALNLNVLRAPSCAAKANPRGGAHGRCFFIPIIPFTKWNMLESSIRSIKGLTIGRTPIPLTTNSESSLL
jgi:hypothetical protein